jgi:hypothetical protein
VGWLAPQHKNMSLSENIDMLDKEENPMSSWIAKYDAALADKETLASIYDKTWRRSIHLKLLKTGDICYLGNAFGYQAPFFEEEGLISKGWQYRLEEGAKILIPRMSKREQRHLAKRMRDTESTSAEEELLLARGFALEFEQEAMYLPQASSGSTRPEFEVNANGHLIMVEAKGRLIAKSLEQEREQMRKIESMHDIRIEASTFDDKIDEWIKNKIYKTLKKKAIRNKGFILVLSIYTFPSDLCAIINMVREFAENPGEPVFFRKNPGDLNLPEEHWALAIALVFHGIIQGVWFNTTLCNRLNINTTTQERIRMGIKNSFYPRRDRILFDEDMNNKEHKFALYRMGIQEKPYINSSLIT